MTESERDQERITYWLSIAQYDLDTAETVLTGGRYLYVGFMCHQVIEKTLKACYVKHRQGVPPYSHNLGYLGRESGIYDFLSEEQKDFLDSLEPLNIESRYPDYKKKIMDGLSFAKSKEIFEQTKELHTWLQKRL